MKHMMFQLEKDLKFTHFIFIYENNIKKDYRLLVQTLFTKFVYFLRKSSINFEKNFKRFLFQ